MKAPIQVGGRMIIWVGLFIGFLSPVSAKDSIILLPQKIKLTGPAAHQPLLVEQARDNEFVGQITNQLSFTSSDSRVVKIENGVALPVTNGTARISVKVGAQTSVADVTVEAMERPFEWSFRNHVQPVLAKAGCSAGACHGAAAGQNGFKLSLRGYDNEGDFLALTRNALERRITPADPGRSLMLLKPTAVVPHKGGKRFEVDSPDYRVLSEWIAAGAPGPKTSDPRIERIAFIPDHAVLQPGQNHSLLVQAHFSDGHIEDVTRWVKYNAANATVTQVDDSGNVKVIGNGESAVTGWYLSRIAVATITVPFPNKINPETFSKATRRNFIDDLVLEKLRRLNLPPSPRSGDAEFIRRIFLDTIGVLPTPEETREFVKATSPQKRDALIEKLLVRPEFVDYWAYKWSDLLLVNSKKLKPAAMWSYYNWIRNRVAANTPWNAFVREIVTADGSTLENGAGNFYVLHDDPRALTETASLAFLGMSINCAKCHNHPMEKWTNDEYYGMANLFARVRSKSGPADGENIIFASSEGDLVQPLHSRPQPPRPLDGRPLAADFSADRRGPLADWLVSRDNPYFSRAIANRIWKNYFGIGLVENVDDLRVTNPASNETLLTAAANYLADQKFDLKALMRVILQSETYQRTSATLVENAADSLFYSHYFPRRMMAEVMLDALSQATASPSRFPGYPEAWRAVQLPDVNVDSYFLKTFGRPDRLATCACERTVEPSVTQLLHLSNGDTLNKKLEAPGNRISRLIATKASPETVINELYLSALSRMPMPVEKEKFLKLLHETGDSDRRPLLEDISWAILSSKEFLFNH